MVFQQLDLYLAILHMNFLPFRTKVSDSVKMGSCFITMGCAKVQQSRQSCWINNYSIADRMHALCCIWSKLIQHWQNQLAQRWVLNGFRPAETGNLRQLNLSACITNIHRNPEQKQAKRILSEPWSMCTALCMSVKSPNSLISLLCMSCIIYPLLILTHAHIRTRIHPTTNTPI